MSEPVLDHSLLPAGCTVLCAVSGGADSVCLLDLVRRLGDVTVLCAHFDHGIRGAESARDAAFVEALCKEWGVPFFPGRGDVPAYAAANGLSIETAAREARYAFLERTAKEQGADVIATAHNLNDNAETILFRMARGTGLHGLTGIPARRGRIVRPLLQTPRRDIEEYLTARGIPHVEDSTNAETDAARNRIRLDVLPKLESIHPGAAAGIARMSETLAEDEAFLASLAEEKLALWGEAIPGAELCAMPRPVARRALARWLAENSRASGSTRCCALPPETATACWSFRDGASGGSSGSFGSARGTRRRWRSACFCPEKRSFTPAGGAFRAKVALRGRKFKLRSTLFAFHVPIYVVNCPSHPAPREIRSSCTAAAVRAR